jgi:hypothetical protein
VVAIPPKPERRPPPARTKEEFSPDFSAADEIVMDGEPDGDKEDKPDGDKPDGDKEDKESMELEKKEEEEQAAQKDDRKDGNEEEESALQQEDPPSDPEDERKQVEKIVKSISALVAFETEKAKNAQKDAELPSRLALLMQARQLMQMHVSGDSAGSSNDLDVEGMKCEKKTADADMQTDGDKPDEAEPSDKRTSKNQEKGKDENEDEDYFLVPQARQYMVDQGYASFDQIINGRTLVHVCCQDSQKRKAIISFSNFESLLDFRVSFQSDQWNSLKLD